MLKYRNFIKASLYTSVATALLLPASMSFAQENTATDRELLLELQKELKALKAENEAVKNEISKLKAAPAATGGTVAYAPQTPGAVAASPADGPITYDSKGGFIHFPGSDTKIKVGGYVKADAIYDINTNRAGNGQDFAIPATIPLTGAETDGDNFRMHARQTRANITSITKTELGDLKLFVEADMFGTAGSEVTTNGHNFQLRHAYGELGPVLIGQAWSNWMDLDAYPETTDYVGPAGISLIRQAQARYTHTLNPTNKLAVSIENPASDLSDINSASLTGLDRAPDVTARYTHTGDYGFVSLKGLVRRFETDALAGGDDSDWGYGVGVAGKFNLGGKDNLRYQVAYGEGLGRYIFDVASSAAPIGGTGLANDIELSAVAAGYAAYQHYWNDKWRSNIIGGYTHIDNNVTATQIATPASPISSNRNLNNTVYTAEANLIWQPLPRYQTGISYTYGYRDTDASTNIAAPGEDGELNRIMWSNWFLF